MHLCHAKNSSVNIHLVEIALCGIQQDPRAHPLVIDIAKCQLFDDF